MDKIKNILGKQHNNESVAEPGQTTGTSTHAGGLSGEGSHLVQANNPPAGTTSGLTGNQTSGTTDISSSSGQHHLGRDDAVGAGNVGLAEHEYRKHENERDLGSATTAAGPHPSNVAKADPRIHSDLDNSRTVGNSGIAGSDTTPGNHLGRDTAAVGTTGAVEEGIDLHRENERGLEANTEAGNPGTNQGSSDHTGPTGTVVPGPHGTDTANRLDPNINASGTGLTRLEDAHQHSETHGGGAEAADKHHHLGRDAAIGAGGVGLAGHEYHKHQNEQDTGVGATLGLGQSTNDQPITSSAHHLGRDAVVGAGGVGLTEHEHRMHENERGPDSGISPASTTGTDSLPGPAPNTAGPHSKDWMNKLDPRVDANPTKAATTGQTSTLPSRGVAQPSGGTIEQTTHHGGRDAVVAGGAGGVAYEADKHHKHDKDLTQAERDAKREQKHELKEEKREHKDHHYGRDVAVAGGVGGIAYETDKHHRKNELNEPNTLGDRGSSAITGQPTKTAATTTAGIHSSNIANRADPTADSDRSKGHHYGRDAAIAGGVGGAAYEADKHHKHDKDLTQAERDAKKEQKHELKEEKKEHKENKGGLFGFLHRDKNKKYTPEEDAEFDRQEREHNASQKGGDTAIGGAAGAGAGAGALYESDKHQRTGETADNNKPLPTAPGNNGIGTGAGTQNALSGGASTSDHHYGRDASLGAGAVGAAAVAEHEHNKDQAGSVPLAEKPRGTDLGDKLHGVERNRGVPGVSGYPGTEGFGAGPSRTGVKSEATTDQDGRPLETGAALGAGSGLAAHEHRKHDSGYAAGVVSNQTGQYGSTTGSGLTGSQQGHHTGRDAMVLGGAGLVGEHEYRKHEGATGQHSGLTGSNAQGQFDDINTGSGLTGSQETGHHTGRDAAGLGAAGLVGEHEYRKHDTTSGFTGSGNQSGLTGSNTTGFQGVNQGVDGRNRLHKDPPADHPAAHADSHVPTSGAERGGIPDQGQGRIDDDTRVASSHAVGGVNAASNY